MSLLFDGIGGPFLVLLLVFVAVTAALWLLLPFSIFGIKTKLDEQLKVLRSLDRNIERLQRTLTERGGGAAPPARPNPAVEAEAARSGLPDEAEPREETPVSASPPRRADDRWQKPPHA